MRRTAAAALTIAALAAACTNGSTASETSTTVPGPSVTSGEAESTTPTTTTTTVTAQATPSTAAPKPTLAVRYEPAGFYTEGSVLHLELFRYFDSTDAFPLLVAEIDVPSPAEATTLIDAGREPGTYELRSYQRACVGTCDTLTAPVDGCAVRLELPRGTTAEVTLRSTPDSPCNMEVSGAAADEPELGMGLTNQPIGTETCDPPSPFDDRPEVLATSTGDAVAWGLLWERPPLIPGREVKMVFRLTGEGDFGVHAIHPDGTTIDPSWGPTNHGTNASSYGRPGNEWGMAFTFPKSGCWNVQLTRGEDTADAWIQVGS